MMQCALPAVQVASSLAPSGCKSILRGKLSASKRFCIAYPKATQETPAHPMSRSVNTYTGQTIPPAGSTRRPLLLSLWVALFAAFFFVLATHYFFLMTYEWVRGILVLAGGWIILGFYRRADRLDPFPPNFAGQADLDELDKVMTEEQKKRNPAPPDAQ